MKFLFARESSLLARMLLYAGLSVALLIFDKHTVVLQDVRAAFSVPVTSLQFLVSWPVHFVRDWGSALGSYSRIVAENRALHTEQLLLHAEMGRLDSLESENKQLRALLHSSAEVRGKVLIARILAVGTDPFIHQVTVDRGRRDGLFVGQPVLDAYGVVGQVIRVNPLTAQVLLISDPHSGVPVEVVRSGVRAVAAGDLYSGKLRLTNVPQTADVKVGDLLVTSGMGNNYPHGYPVGQVSSVKQETGLPFSTILVDLAAHINRSWQILLVWPDKVKA
ncbi:MAG: rod shape-determining protein MreC [Gammaproteobacteria bacterium]|nr:rod shape-determining protein MreC [Gammaproteobacteria bacterium]